MSDVRTTYVYIRSLFLLSLTVVGTSSLSIRANSVDTTFNAVPSNPLSVAKTSGLQQVVQPDGKLLVFGIKGVVDGAAKADVFRITRPGR
jgi:hypothetical protein